ncbi:MAG: N-acetyl-gamma-glutamyl-phosphate reductase [Candidatus Symbiothrix sp.]|jgi:N-acetyl-gamma-glutamyl-phosphate reductase|nr:N-acetyl-gamma-glutamyl-phosphate reductase [Candidatus Symbiothrix sp.]
MKKIKIGIIGGAGYTAGELLRILLHHPQAEIVFVQSGSNAGNAITDVHGGLIGETDLRFSALPSLATTDVEALFLCSAHGDSRKFMEENHVPDSLKIIDLSMDYRHRATSDGFVYGLPERNKPTIVQARRIANPGCFATAIQLALLPLAATRNLTGEVHVHAVTGSTGAGVKPSATGHFSWRDNNLSVYKVFEHQHLKEICESLECPISQINFVPVRGDFPRGIFATAYTDSALSVEEAQQLYSDFYHDAAFTFVSDKNIDMKQVVNTNKCLLHLEKHGNKLFIISIIDNLLKGASGQAVQNFNLMFGLDEKIGLRLKASGF